MYVCGNGNKKVSFFQGSLEEVLQWNNGQRREKSVSDGERETKSMFTQQIICHPNFLHFSLLPFSQKYISSCFNCTHYVLYLENKIRSQSPFPGFL